MRRTALLLMTGLLLSLCSQKYVAHSVIDPAFDTKRTYTVAIMPLLVRGPLETPGAFERDRVYGFLLRRLMETGKLKPMDKATIDRSVGLQEFGQQGTVSPAKAREIGKELGAELVCLAEVSIDQESVISATVDILDVGATATVYSGSARAANPASTIAAAEFALEQATEKLVQRMR
ncbi:MAG: hypothetical protein NTX53_05100 [candidate division WOR-3 bacterium]|nr:hypothetical protein [candidate division WOR-3 bacterium]